MVESIWSISPERLHQLGIRALILDLDNTLVDWSQEYLRAEVLTWAQECRQAGLALCICTNARRKPRVTRIAAKLEACYLAGAGKPFRRSMRRALWLLRCEPEQAAMVGDQVFTDIWGANRAGVMSILVKPLCGRDFLPTRISRMMERRLLHRWQQAGKVFQCQL